MHVFCYAHTHTHKTFLSRFFYPSVGRNRDGRKNDGPVSGIENGPHCFTRDLGLGGKTAREGQREREKSADH